MTDIQFNKIMEMYFLRFGELADVTTLTLDLDYLAIVGNALLKAVERGVPLTGPEKKALEPVLTPDEVI